MKVRFTYVSVRSSRFAGREPPVFPEQKVQHHGPAAPPVISGVVS